MSIVWIAVAFLLGLVANAAGLPPLLGYLAGGFLLGALGAEGGELLHALAHYGVIFLLFALGLHIRLRNMVRLEVVGSGLSQLLISVVLLSGLFTLFGVTATLGWPSTLMLAVLLGVASTVVAAKGLEERSALESYAGRVAIGILIVEDIVLIGVLAFIGLAAPSPWALLVLGLPLLRPLLLRVLRYSRHEELYLLYGLLLALGGAYAFELVGISGELGAFIAGVLLAGSPEAEEIAERMWSLREAFLVAFFLEIGLGGLPSWNGVLFALALMLFLPLRGAIFFGLLSAFGLRARTAFLSAASLLSFSEFALITGAVAAQAGIIPAEMVVALALTVALSFVLGAPASRFAPRLYPRLKPFLARFERDVRHPDAQPETLGSARYLVVGMGRTGIAAYERIEEGGGRVVGLDNDPGKLEALRQAGKRVAYGDAGDRDLWEDLNLQRLQGIILTIPELETKVQAVRTLRDLGFSGAITTTRLSDGEYELLEAAGASSICHPLNEAGFRLAEEIVNPGGREVAAVPADD
jgi:glutathione-regulated potassium-efflux system ancillary protein KefC